MDPGAGEVDPRVPASDRARSSRYGEREMFAVQTNKTCNPSSSDTKHILSGAAGQD